jgi:hypothetical protein
MKPLVQTVNQKLISSNIKNKKGQIVCDLAGISFYINNRDILGGIIQQWLGEFLDANKIKWSPPKNSQTWPDIILNNGDHLEVKCFDADESPGFDLANFGSYINSLLITPERLDDDYIIIGYQFDGQNLSIQDFWIKNIWEITGPSDTHFLNLQVKRDIVYNIRPKNWRNSNVVTFKNRREFVLALSQAVEKFDYGTSKVWFKKVEDLYKIKTSKVL